MYNELFVSNGGKYFGGVVSLRNDTVDTVSIDIFKSDGLNKIDTIKMPGSIGGDRFAISSDGELIASAVYNDFGKGLISIYSITEKKFINEINNFNRVDWISFYEKMKLIIGKNEKTYFYDLTSSDFTEEKVFRVINYDNVDVIWKKRNLVLIGGKRIKSKTFAFFKPVYALDGIIVSEIGGNVIKYSLDGDIVWEIDISELGHAINLYYIKQRNTIFLDVFNYTRGGMTCVIVDNENGTIINKHTMPIATYTVVPNENGLIICDDGSVYALNDNFDLNFVRKLK